MTLTQILVSVLIALVGVFGTATVMLLLDIRKEAREGNARVGKLETHVAETYVTKADFDRCKDAHLKVVV